MPAADKVKVVTVWLVLFDKMFWGDNFLCLEIRRNGIKGL